MARIYTRTGDSGETSLGDGSRVPKSGPRVALYGEVDELSSWLGQGAAALAESGLEVPGLSIAVLQDIQSRLFSLGAILAHPSQSRETAALPPEEQPFVPGELETLIDTMDGSLAPLKNFILPGGCAVAAALHLARAVCRRVERGAVALAAAEPVPAGAVTYLNRLSDFLFTAARAANAASGIPDVPWTDTKGDV
ncbi:MAG: cob(I)yrinic acid a,c-diamide adenosyltransferase [Candidatus Krumholzibacteriota bacterium]